VAGGTSLSRLALAVRLSRRSNTLHRSRYRRPAGFAAVPSRLESGAITWTSLQTTVPLVLGAWRVYQTVFQVAESSL
jgi:hypothetical protein